MSAAPKILEGTWEEISKHAHELAGHHLRVIIVDQPSPYDHPAFDTSPDAVKARVERIRKWATDRPPVGHFVDDSRDAIYEDYLK